MGEARRRGTREERIEAAKNGDGCERDGRNPARRVRILTLKRRESGGNTPLEPGDAVRDPDTGVGYFLDANGALRKIATNRDLYERTAKQAEAREARRARREVRRRTRRAEAER